MKKFYKKAEAGTAPGGYVVRLDGKMIRTPLLKPLLFDSEALAQEIAAEWAAQGDEIVPQSMPMMQYASTMIDKADSHERPAMNAELLRYAGSDLVCYFATHPAGLVARQESHWRPLLEWLKTDKDIHLQSVSGIQYHHQSHDDLQKIKDLINGLSPAAFTVVQLITGMTGSIVIALAFLDRQVTPEQAYQAAVVDEVYQQEQWGVDEVAQKRLDNIAHELRDIGRFRDYLLSE